MTRSNEVGSIIMLRSAIGSGAKVSAIRDFFADFMPLPDSMIETFQLDFNDRESVQIRLYYLTFL